MGVVHSEFGVSSRATFKEAEDALLDIDVIPFEGYPSELEEAKKLVGGENVRKVLAAALKVDPDYFISGDKHFQVARVRGRLPVVGTRKALKKIEGPTESD